MNAPLRPDTSTAAGAHQEEAAPLIPDRTGRLQPEGIVPVNLHITAVGALTVVAGWILIAVALCVPVARSQRLAKQPPLPEPEHDADWIAAWPLSIDDVDELDRRFFAIVDSTSWFVGGEQA